MYDRETAASIVKGNLEMYLSWQGIDTRRPFRCLNPDHQDKHASMSIDRSSRSGIHCKCFSCNAYYDTFDLIRINEGITDDAELFKRGYELFNLEVEGAEYQNQPKIERNTHTQNSIHNNTYTIEPINDKPQANFNTVIEAAHKTLLESPAALKHFADRGLSEEIIKRYKLGYIEAGHNALLKDRPGNQAKSQKIGLYKYVLPFTDAIGDHNYFITEISDRGQTDDYNAKYRNINRGEGQDRLDKPLFNERYIQRPELTPEAIFICEGIFDALAVEEAGGAAIAFIGTAHNRFLSLCKKYMPKTTFILSLDNDQAGAKATAAVKEGLNQLQIPYIERQPANNKDFNEALLADRGSFIDFIAEARADAKEEQQRELEAQKEEYLTTSTAHYIQDFINDIEKSKTAPCYSTGFNNLDEILDGGFYSALYVVGAITALGKTTFCLQISDNIAAAGHDVLIFSLEMARAELMAKSISRHTLLQDMEQNGSTSNAKTTRGIMVGKRFEGYSQTEKGIIIDAIKAYGDYAERIFIHEGIGDIGIDEIRETVELHIKLTGKRPVVLIDYLQILAPYNDRATDKQNTDKAVLELKRLSRDLSIPVIGISSFNRDNYTAPVNLAAFKESGAIEYSSDVIIGLQYEGMDYAEGESENARKKRIRELLAEQEANGRNAKAQDIQVKILKNRNGKRGSTVLEFYPMFNYYTEKEGITPAAAYEDTWQTISSTDNPFEE